MSTTITSKGQVTIPKRIREALRLEPGAKVEFDVDDKGRVLIRPARPASSHNERDRFESARGKATVHSRTEELMRLLRDED